MYIEVKDPAKIREFEHIKRGDLLPTDDPWGREMIILEVNKTYDAFDSSERPAVTAIRFWWVLG